MKKFEREEIKKLVDGMKTLPGVYKKRLYRARYYGAAEIEFLLPDGLNEYEKAVFAAGFALTAVQPAGAKTQTFVKAARKYLKNGVSNATTVLGELISWCIKGDMTSDSPAYRYLWRVLGLAKKLGVYTDPVDLIDTLLYFDDAKAEDFANRLYFGKYFGEEED